MNPLTINLANQPEVVATGDLTDAAHSQSPTAFTLDPSVFKAAVLGAPISAISGDSVSASLKPSHDFSWTQQISSADSVTFKVTPSVNCSLIVRKKGAVLDAPDVDGDPIDGSQLQVPAGKGYVSIILKVMLDVSGCASASLPDGIGLKASADSNHTFVVANHFVFDQTRLVKDAILESLGRFVLPFGSAAKIATLNSGDIVESEFVAKLDLTAGVSWGYSGSFLAGPGKGDLQAAAKSDIGSLLLKAAPSIDLGLSLTVDYTHTDAFRSVAVVQDASVSLLIFKCESGGPTVTLDADASVDPGLSAKIATQLPQALQNAGKRLAGGTSAFGTAVGAAVGAAGNAVQAGTDDVNNAINNEIAKLPKLGIDASVSVGKITAHTVLASLVFNRPAGGGLDAPAWAAAMSGNLRQALMLGSGPSDVKLGAGSYVETSLTKTTTFTFTFFDLKAQTVDQYFSEVKVIYNGGGSYQFLAKVGSGATSVLFGSRTAAVLYFTVSASLAANLPATNKDVKLCIVLSDQNASGQLMLIGRTLTALLSSAKSAPYIAALNKDLSQNAQLPVSLSAQFTANSFNQLKASAKPYTDQSADRANFDAFIAAYNALASRPNEGIPSSIASIITYDNWVKFNMNVNNLTAGPDRTETGHYRGDPTVFTGIVAPGDEDSPSLIACPLFFEEARFFMDFCGDLIELGHSINPTSTGQEATLASLMKRVNFSVKDVTTDPLHFLNAYLVALVRQMGSVRMTASDLPASDAKSFEIDLQIDVGATPALRVGAAAGI